MENSNTPVYPLVELNKTTGNPCGQFFGITMREYFAAMAMQGILSNPNQIEKFQVNDWGIDSRRIAECAIDAADELLKQLNTK